MMRHLRSLIRKAWWGGYALRQAITRREPITGLPLKPRKDQEHLGSRYGGWVVPIKRLGPRPVCYCCGVGLDISFDRALIERCQAEVHAFDPTPASVAFAGAEAARVQGFHFHPVGVWSRDEVLYFHPPAREGHVSHSILNLQGRTEGGFEASCQSLPSLMRDLGHTRIDLLKLDIEGAEYEVLTSVLDHRLDIPVLCVEFDEAHSPLDPGWRSRIAALCHRLADAGYRLTSSRLKCNFTFVRDG